MTETSISPPYLDMQPRPRFCIFRPGGQLSPLIPLDELPSWLHVGNFGSELNALQPVSLSFIPRQGEYDVICHNCSSSVDSLHQSTSHTSQSNSDSQAPDSPQSAGETKSCPVSFFTQAAECDVQAILQPITIMSQPPIPASVQNPILGMYMLQMPAISSNVMPSVMRTPAAMEKARDIASTCSHIGSDLFEKTYPRDGHQSSGSDADSERSVPRSDKTVIPARSKRVDSPDPRVDRVASPSSRTGFDAAAEMKARLQESVAKDDTHEAMSVINESIASTRSLTAAVMRLGQLLAEGKIRRPANFDLRALHRTGFKKDSAARPRALSIHAPSKRVRVRNRRRRADKPAKSKPNVSKVKDEPQLEKSKPKQVSPEQTNSSTKRRERREKLHKGKKDSASRSRFTHMMTTQNGPEPLLK